jgi:hypothetical protein
MEHGIVAIDSQDLIDLCIQAKSNAQEPVAWTEQEIADGNRGIRWVTSEGIRGRPTDHDVREYLKNNSNAVGCHCDECNKFYAAPTPSAERVRVVQMCKAHEHLPYKTTVTVAAHTVVTYCPHCEAIVGRVE